MMVALYATVKEECFLFLFVFGLSRSKLGLEIFHIKKHTSKI